MSEWSAHRDTSRARSIHLAFIAIHFATAVGCEEKFPRMIDSDSKPFEDLSQQGVLIQARFLSLNAQHHNIHPFSSHLM